jgi:hypothetical protein
MILYKAVGKIFHFDKYLKEFTEDAYVGVRVESLKLPRVNENLNGMILSVEFYAVRVRSIPLNSLK